MSAQALALDPRERVSDGLLWIGKGPRWSDAEDSVLRALAPTASVRQIREAVVLVRGLPRSYYSVVARAARLRVALQTGEYMRSTPAGLPARAHGCGARTIRDWDHDDGPILRCLLCGWQAPVLR